VIDLQSGNMRAVLAPAHGGAVLSLSCDGVDILRPASSLAAVAADPREAACYPCVPWFSRLVGGLDFDGRHYDLAPTLPACDPEHALHGHGWVSEWRVTAQTANRLQCRFDHAPRPRVFPFAFRAQQDFSLSDNDFSIQLSVTNTGETRMPAGLGLHPFFPCNGNTRLNVVERPEKRPLPGDLQSPDIVDHSGPIPAEPVDYTIRGWDGHAEIIHNGKRIAMRGSAPLLHLYSPEEADFYCAEPITHLPGRFGEDILAPGETASLQMTLSV